MREHSLWSIGLGRWGGVTVRLHMFFVLFAALTLMLASQHGLQNGQAGFVGLAVGSLVLLLLSVLLHELAHAVVAVRLGAYVDQIVVGPIGGMVPFRMPSNPRCELVISVAGPLANLLICLICVPIVWLWLDLSPISLLNPLQPFNLISGTIVQVSFKLAFWINWFLFLVNVLPAYPLDGGRALRAALLVVRPDMNLRTAVIQVATLAKISALGLCIAAWFVSTWTPVNPIPIWFALVLLAICIFFSARYELDRFQEEQGGDELFGYDFSQGYTSLEQSTDTTSFADPSPLARWIERRREQRHRRQRETEEDEDRRVDEILSRLNEGSMNALSAEDRRLLNRVSARYRSRMEG